MTFTVGATLPFLRQRLKTRFWTYARVARDVLLIAIHMLQITQLFLVTLHHRYPAVMLLMTMLTSRPRQCAAPVAAGGHVKIRFLFQTIPPGSHHQVPRSYTKA